MSKSKSVLTPLNFKIGLGVLLVSSVANALLNPNSPMSIGIFEETATLSPFDIEVTRISRNFSPACWVELTPGVVTLNETEYMGEGGTFIGHAPCARDVYVNFAQKRFVVELDENGMPLIHTAMTFTPETFESLTPSYTPEATYTAEPTSTATNTITPIFTVTATRTVTPTYTLAPSRTPTRTFTLSPTVTASRTPSPTVTASRTPTPTSTQTASSTSTHTPTPRETNTTTFTPTFTQVPPVTPIKTPAPFNKCDFNKDGRVSLFERIICKWR